MNRPTPDKPPVASPTIGSPQRESEDRRRGPNQPADAGAQYGKRSSEERNDPAVQPGAVEGNPHDN